MEIFNRVKNAVRAFNETKRQKNSIDPAADFLRYGPRNPIIGQNWSQVQMSDQDMYKGYGYAVIKRRADRAAVLGKNFLDTKATDKLMEQAKQKDEELKHPYLQLIEDSKEFTEKKFWHDISTYLDLEGIYYLMAVRAVSQPNAQGEVTVGAVQKFVMLNPYQVRRVIRESDGTVGGYVESRNGMYREIPKEMIIEIRLLNPFNQDEAYSMTDAAKESQFTMMQAGDYARHAIQGNINAPGAISTDVQLDDHLFDNFISRIKNHDKGEPLYGNGTGAINWESMQIDLDKAALDKINEINRQILFAVSGTSKTTVGIEESGTTRDTSEVQKQNFTENAVMPQIEDIIDALNLDYRKWYPEWEQNHFEIILDNPLQSDREAELKDIEIRESEYDITQKLVGAGYEYELAAKYAHGDITLQELGEPTLEPELSDQQAEAMARSELGIQPPVDQTNTEPKQGNEVAAISNDIDEKQNNSIIKDGVLIRFVSKEENEKRLKQARKRVKDAEKVRKATEKAEKQAQKDKKNDDKAITDPAPKKEAKTEVKVVVHPAEEPKATANEVETTVTNQIAARDYEMLYENLEIDPRAISDDDYRGCIMVNTEVIPVTQFVKNGEQDLVEAERPEDHTMGAVSEVEPHATLLFGLLNNGNIWKDKVNMLLSGWEMPNVTIDQVSYFDLGDKYAVVGLLERTPEIVDGHERLTLLPHVNTFSEYHPHITLAYVKHDADIEKWIKALGKKYNGQIVATKGINYGDLPESEDTDNFLEAKQANMRPVEAPTSHDCSEHGFIPNSELEKATNALEPAVRENIILQEANLQQAVARIERDIAQKALEATQTNDTTEEPVILTETEEENYVAELAAILAAYYLVLFPIYAAQLLALRLSEFSLQGVFAMNDKIQRYIEDAARKAAQSHIQTVLRDFTRTYVEAQDNATKSALVTIIEQKVGEQDKTALDKLPENPNREDIESAVNRGTFEDEQAYALARKLAREGVGRETVQKELQKTFANMTATRAKTIAHHEASRVFNMSQYEADKQFLKASGYLNRAYKRLRSRTGEPCAVCSMLIAETRANPIPFEKNFADLGDVLTASYRKDNGKMAVQKVPINYEAIMAGNVHVHCNCDYELVIIQEDGTVLNDIRFAQINAKGDKYNPYRDNEGKFASGPAAKLVDASENVKKVKAAKKVLQRDYSKLDPNDFAAAIKEDYGDQAEWDDKEQGAIDDYTSNGYQEINGFLRDPSNDFYDDNRDELNEFVAYLDSAMKNKLKKDTPLYRGLITDAELTKGTQILTRGFNSTSFNHDVAEDFAKGDAYRITGNKRPVVLKINARKGQKGIIPILESDEKGLRAAEAEFILPRGMTFEVTNVNVKADYEEVEVEIINA